MKLNLPLRCARDLSIVAVTERLFSGLFIDTPQILNSGWISALGGAVLCLPMVWLGDRFIKAHSPRPVADSLAESAGAGWTRLLAAVLCLTLLYDFAAVMRLNNNSASYVALSNVSATFQILPLVLVMLFSAWKNGQTAGSAALLWMRLFPFLFVISLILQWTSLQPRWLLPVLGPGLRQLGKGTLSAAGWIAPIAAAWLASEPGKEDLRKNLPLSRAVFFIGAAASVFLAILAMMSPADVFGNPTRSFQFDKLLSNGRVALMLQLPMTLLWFNGTLFMLLFDLFLSAKMLQIVLPRLDGRLALCACALAGGAIALSGWAEQYLVQWVGRWQYLIVSVPFAATLGIALIRKGGKTA
ncbi:MAG TPA: GerAB/ArcD/ProY family transporter [Candidatus Pullichristensenella excrementigallinarum]|uniref:GerAB/ArcD/ProY family transporter n=1 Tax=Candidatus Pullichristensenella excrementigallinarum TaxID=2840907 RepID=A0A9D1LCP0_9FIRM|nr:GerAB/ArcD/ProY family transporter [Candidatus Pullichristensenella excrementigallinarum]